jgi:carbon monoxide dehydrogenase subunit G
MKVGPVSAASKAITLSDLDPPNGYKISGEGEEAGRFCQGRATVGLAEGWWHPSEHIP